MTRRIAPLFLLTCLPTMALAQGDPPDPTQRDTTPLTLPTIEVPDETATVIRDFIHGTSGLHGKKG